MTKKAVLTTLLAIFGTACLIGAIILPQSVSTTPAASNDTKNADLDPVVQEAIAAHPDDDKFRFQFEVMEDFFQSIVVANYKESDGDITVLDENGNPDFEMHISKAMPGLNNTSVEVSLSDYPEEIYVVESESNDYSMPYRAYRKSDGKVVFDSAPNFVSQIVVDDLSAEVIAEDASMLGGKAEVISENNGEIVMDITVPGNPRKYSLTIADPNKYGFYSVKSLIDVETGFEFVITEYPEGNPDEVFYDDSDNHDSNNSDADTQ